MFRNHQEWMEIQNHNQHAITSACFTNLGVTTACHKYTIKSASYCPSLLSVTSTISLHVSPLNILNNTIGAIERKLEMYKKI